MGCDAGVWLEFCCYPVSGQQPRFFKLQVFMSVDKPNLLGLCLERVQEAKD